MAGPIWAHSTIACQRTDVVAAHTHQRSRQLESVLTRQHPAALPAGQRVELTIRLPPRREVRRAAPSGIRSIVPVERRPASYGSNRAKQG
ncbi:MAG: hypothetical protein JWR46_1356 [Mycobacterium sp.]|jgi:hypothetical protein|nr:hypothetical protein [Mycobacterium sp.]MCW2731946.1 hypothetical protein [Mycobacterium sp.]